MEGERETLSDFFQVELSQNSVKSKRRSNCMKMCFSKNVRLLKKKKLIVDDAYQKPPLFGANNCTSKTNFKINDLTSKTTLPKYIKPCSVNLIPLDPMIYAIYNANVAHNASPYFLQLNEKGTFNGLKHGDHKNQLRSIKSIRNLKKSRRKKHSTSDLMKTLKSCSVIIKKIDLNDFSRDIKVNFPTSHFSADGIELKPCVQFPQLNVKGTKKSIPRAVNVVKPCVDKSKNIATDIFSVLKNCNHDLLDDMNVKNSKEAFQLMTSSGCKNIGSSVTLREEVLFIGSSRGQVCPNKIAATKAYVQCKNSIEGSAQNSSKSLSLNNYSVKSNLSGASDTHLSDFDSLKNEKSSKTVELVEDSKFAREEYIEYDSNDTYSGQKLQIASSPFGPSCGLETNFEKAQSLKSSVISKTKTISYFFANNWKSNEPSSFTLAFKPSPMSCDNKEVQCQQHTSESKSHYCFQCGKALPTLKSFYYHLCLGKQKRGYPCKFCMKNFDFYHSLKKHKICHALKNSLSCSDTMKSRHRNKSIRKANCVLEIEKKAAIKVLNSGKDVKKLREGKENNNSSKLKQKKLKTKFFLQNKWDATTSSGSYSSDSSFLPYICNPDDSEVD